MEDAELVEKLLAGLKEKGKQDTKTKSLLDDIASTRMKSLQEAITEIAQQINEREKLHAEMLDDIEAMKSAINNMTPQITADNAKVVLEFQKKLIEAEEIKIEEKLNRFRDISQLKKELREWIREFRDKEGRASLLDELISDS